MTREVSIKVLGTKVCAGCQKSVRLVSIDKGPAKLEAHRANGELCPGGPRRTPQAWKRLEQAKEARRRK